MQDLFKSRNIQASKDAKLKASAYIEKGKVVELSIKDRMDDSATDDSVAKSMMKLSNSKLVLVDKKIRHNAHGNRFLLTKSNIGPGVCCCKK